MIFQKKLEGYKFPVYSTEFCPRNESEWNKRSSALSCNKTNGYTCLPNENFTELLEFCYTQPFIWIQGGTDKMFIVGFFFCLCSFCNYLSIILHIPIQMYIFTYHVMLNYTYTYTCINFLWVYCKRKILNVMALLWGLKYLNR